MDFEVIDSVHADTLAKGDIICVDGDFHQLRSDVDVDSDGCVSADTYNLSTGDDEDSIVLDEHDVENIYRTF